MCRFFVPIYGEVGRYCLQLYSWVFLYDWMCELLRYIKWRISDSISLLFGKEGYTLEENVFR
jgi:hypothetical protein